MKILCSAIFLLLITILPASAHPVDDDAAAIKQNIIAMWASIEKGDVEGYLDYVHDDYTLFGEGDIYLQSGRDKERASYADYLKRVKNVRTFMHQPEFHVRGDTAWVTYYWTDSGYTNDGERFTSKGKSTRIFVKEEGKWLCIHGHFTDVK